MGLTSGKYCPISVPNLPTRHCSWLVGLGAHQRGSGRTRSNRAGRVSSDRHVPDQRRNSFPGRRVSIRHSLEGLRSEINIALTKNFWLCDITTLKIYPHNNVCELQTEVLIMLLVLCCWNVKLITRAATETRRLTHYFAVYDVLLVFSWASQLQIFCSVFLLSKVMKMVASTHICCSNKRVQFFAHPVKQWHQNGKSLLWDMLKLFFCLLPNGEFLLNNFVVNSMEKKL